MKRRLGFDNSTLILKKDEELSSRRRGGKPPWQRYFVNYMDGPKERVADDKIMFDRMVVINNSEATQELNGFNSLIHLDSGLPDEELLPKIRRKTKNRGMNKRTTRF